MKWKGQRSGPCEDSDGLEQRVIEIEIDKIGYNYKMPKIVHVNAAFGNWNFYSYL